MKHKKLIVALILIVVIVVSFIVIRNIRLKNAAEIELRKWEEQYNISVEKFSVQGNLITVYWDDFGHMTESQMLAVVKSTKSFHEFELRYIISDGQKYFISRSLGAEVKLNDVYGKTVAYESGHHSSNSNSSSSSEKTATCNYCHGTGKVNGDTCPWCNGSGKTYDNSFNDLLGN